MESYIPASLQGNPAG